jgi:hypothetical protein
VTAYLVVLRRVETLFDIETASKEKKEPSRGSIIRLLAGVHSLDKQTFWLIDSVEY